MYNLQKKAQKEGKPEEKREKRKQLDSSSKKTICQKNGS